MAERSLSPAPTITVCTSPWVLRVCHSTRGGNPRCLFISRSAYWWSWCNRREIFCGDIQIFSINTLKERLWCSSEALWLLSSGWSLYTKHENGPKQHLDSDLAVNEPPLAAEDLSLSCNGQFSVSKQEKFMGISLSALGISEDSKCRNNC